MRRESNSHVWKGLSNRDSSETMHDSYGCNLDLTTISKITDVIQKDIEEFKNKGLEKIILLFLLT